MMARTDIRLLVTSSGWHPGRPGSRRRQGAGPKFWPHSPWVTHTAGDRRWRPTPGGAGETSRQIKGLRQQEVPPCARLAHTTCRRLQVSQARARFLKCTPGATSLARAARVGTPPRVAQTRPEPLRRGHLGPWSPPARKGGLDRVDADLILSRVRPRWIQPFPLWSPTDCGHSKTDFTALPNRRVARHLLGMRALQANQNPCHRGNRAQALPVHHGRQADR